MSKVLTRCDCGHAKWIGENCPRCYTKVFPKPVVAKMDFRKINMMNTPRKKRKSPPERDWGPNYCKKCDAFYPKDQIQSHLKVHI